MNTITNKYIEDITVVPEFEKCDYVSSPLLFNKKGRFYYYKNASLPNPKISKITLVISSPEYYFPECSIGKACMYSVDIKPNEICEVRALPTVKIAFTNTDTSSYPDVSSYPNAGIKLKTKCIDIESKLYHNDITLYNLGQCSIINDSIAEYNFPLLNKMHTLYSVADDSLTIEIRSEKNAFPNKKFSFYLSAKIREINIYVPSMQVEVNER